jgi:hypothetical protein
MCVLSDPLSRGLLNKLTVTQLVKKFSVCNEPQGSLPCSQEHATVLYPEPHDSNPHPCTPYL